ncbi:hypothetical protein H8356DRAFT_1659851 [Neocallimastix lanati (nom. inval.)]|jgi:hypothetical protein|nr:hypothetical protein H8356DRAFT_1659851 [Neocallimastix sp. JGI-2020a]
MEVSLNSTNTSTPKNKLNNSTNSNGSKGAPPVLLNATLEDEKIYYSEEIVRLEHSIKLLEDSNAVLREQGDNDPDFVLAITENEQVIAKYKKIVNNLKERLNALSLTPCLSSQKAGSEINLNKDNSISIVESELNKNLQSLKLTTKEISSLESLSELQNSLSEENYVSKATEKETLKSEVTMSTEEDGVFL